MNGCDDDFRNRFLFLEGKEVGLLLHNLQTHELRPSPEGLSSLADFAGKRVSVRYG